MRHVNISPTTPSPASTAREARRPSSRAVLLADTIASAVAVGTPASSSPARSWLSETNGTPLASSTVALELTDSGTFGSDLMRLKNEVVRATADTVTLPS